MPGPLPCWLLLGVLLGCAPGPAHSLDPSAITAFDLCANPDKHVGQRARIAVQLGAPAFRSAAQTLVACGPEANGCCNSVGVTFLLPCETYHQPRRIMMLPAATLALAPTKVEFTPAIARGQDAGTVTLGCAGCEAGVSCSPADPTTVKAVLGAIALHERFGTVFLVDELEYATLP